MLTVQFSVFHGGPDSDRGPPVADHYRALRVSNFNINQLKFQRFNFTHFTRY